jgi:hypothetical protein
MAAPAWATTSISRNWRSLASMADCSAVRSRERDSLLPRLAVPLGVGDPVDRVHLDLPEQAALLFFLDRGFPGLRGHAASSLCLLHQLYRPSVSCQSTLVS